MRAIYLVLTLFFLSLSAAAQVDAKLNAGSLVTLGINVSAEFAVSPNSSVAVGVARNSLELTVDGDAYDYRNLRLVPEYRYYLAPREGMDGWFAGGYGKLISLRGRAIDRDRQIAANRVVLGVMAGHKWVFPSRVVLELNAGVGGAAFFGGDALFRRAVSTVGSVDFRLGILVGYRL